MVCDLLNLNEKKMFEKHLEAKNTKYPLKRKSCKGSLFGMESYRDDKQGTSSQALLVLELIIKEPLRCPGHQSDLM